MLTLSKPAVAARDTELKLQELLNEFYKYFFTGTVHAAQLGQVTFPPCDLFFNQTQLPSPSTRNSQSGSDQPKPQIHTVFTDLRTTERWLTADSKMVYANLMMSIFVRVANQGAQDNKTDFLCRKIADNLKEIFQSQDRYALAQKGIRHPRIPRGPVPLPTVGFQVRLLVVSCQLQYRIPRSGA